MHGRAKKRAFTCSAKIVLMLVDSFPSWELSSAVLVLTTTYMFVSLKIMPSVLSKHCICKYLLHITTKMCHRALVCILSIHLKTWSSHIPKFRTILGPWATFGKIQMSCEVKTMHRPLQIYYSYFSPYPLYLQPGVILEYIFFLRITIQWVLLISPSKDFKSRIKLFINDCWD